MRLQASNLQEQIGLGGHLKQEKRTEERVGAVLPVMLNGADGLTRDVSASGMFFETSATLTAGEMIDFTVDFDTPAGKRILKCRGEIVRTVEREGHLGVAVRIVDSLMEAGVSWRAPERAAGYT